MNIPRPWQPWSHRNPPVVRWAWFYGCGAAGLLTGLFLRWLFG